MPKKDLLQRALVGAMLHEALDDEEGYDEAMAAEDLKVLKRLSDLYLAEDNVEAGDLVVWKPGLKNRRLPRMGQPAVVLHRYPPGEAPFDDEENSGAPGFRERLDLVLGVVRAGEMLVYHFDSRRFALLLRKEAVRDAID